MKIVTVCGMGIGTAILLKMNTDRALERLGVRGEVEAADLTVAWGVAADADLILTNAETAPGFDGLGTPVRVVVDFMDVGEIARTLTEALNI